MARLDLDWTYLRAGLLRPAIGVVAALLLLAVSSVVRLRTETALAERTQELQGMEEQQRELSSRLEARNRYAERYELLTARGIVGEERRLDWVQMARDTATSLRLPYLRYTASPQRSFTAPYLTAENRAEVRASLVELQAGLVHEGDLLRLFAALARAPGFFQVHGCSLERLGRDVAPTADTANVSGSCQLDWFSIPADGGSVVPTEEG